MSFGLTDLKLCLHKLISVSKINVDGFIRHDLIQKRDTDSLNFSILHEVLLIKHRNLTSKEAKW